MGTQFPGTSPAAGAGAASASSPAMHPLFLSLFIQAPEPDDNSGRRARRRQTLTRTVGRSAQSTTRR